MKTFLTRPRTLLIAGLILMVVGAIDPLEGSVLILLGSALAALGAFLGHFHRRRLQAWAFLLIAIGVGLMFAFSAVGGFGGNTGRSMWWMLTLLPYPIGWVMGLAAVTMMLRKHPEDGRSPDSAPA
jgi:hypothetical protein